MLLLAAAWYRATVAVPAWVVVGFLLAAYAVLILVMLDLWRGRND